MTDTPAPATSPQRTRELSFAKYFWLCAAIVAIPALVLFNFLPLPGAALVIGLAAALIGGGAAAIIARRSGKPVWLALLWAALAGLVLSAPIVWVFDLLLAAAGGTAKQPSFTPVMFLWALPLPVVWGVGALIARVRDTDRS